MFLYNSSSRPSGEGSLRAGDIDPGIFRVKQQEKKG
jgi:hypothetical protein